MKIKLIEHGEKLNDPIIPFLKGMCFTLGIIIIITVISEIFI